MRRWNRKQRTLRNLLLCALLGTAAYVLLGFPPYTTGQKLDRLERTYMLEDLKVVCTGTDRYRYDNDWMDRRYTLVIARSPQGDYVSSSWQQTGLEIQEASWPAQPAVGGLCKVWRGGRFYVAHDDLRGAASATAVVETSRQTFTLEGRREGDGAFSFPYIAPEYRRSRFGRWDTVDPGTEIYLLEAVQLWYYEKEPGPDFDQLIEQDLLCTVTGRDAAGETVAQVDMTISTVDLNNANFLGNW